MNYCIPSAIILTFCMKIVLYLRVACNIIYNIFADWYYYSTEAVLHSSFIIKSINRVSYAKEKDESELLPLNEGRGICWIRNVVKVEMGSMEKLIDLTDLLRMKKKVSVV